MTELEDTKSLARANIAAWDEAAPIHARHNQAALLELFGRGGYSCLDETETAILERLGVAGKDVAQVCCNNGRELLSVKTMGAARCVGFDGAPTFIDQARALATAAGQDVEFICTDVYDIDATQIGQFDLVIITIGVMCWMPDLERFFSIVGGLIKPGGALFVYEQHPILDMLSVGDAGDPVEWEASYFSKEPFVETEGLDYYGGEKYEAKPVTSFNHRLSEVLTAGLRVGLTLEHIEERPEHISNTWYNVEHAGIGLPMSYTLVMRKLG